MSHIVYQHDEIDIVPGETVLDLLLDAGHDIPFGCRAGVCHSCLMKAEEGEVPELAQSGLKDTLKQQGYFLACCCRPESAIRIRSADEAGVRYPVTVTDKTLLNANTLRLRVQTDMDYRPGQYVALYAGGVHRSYSIASVPVLEDSIEFHIRLLPDGVMSQYLLEEVAEGQLLEISEPQGTCFYALERSDQPIVMVGIGTGLAPLYGIARDALHQGHQGQITLLVGAASADTLYYQSELAALATRYDQFSVHYSVLQGDVTPGKEVSPLAIDDLVKTLFPETRGMVAYLCGSAPRVQQLKKAIFVAGANMRDIHCDEFLPS